MYMHVDAENMQVGCGGHVLNISLVMGNAFKNMIEPIIPPYKMIYKQCIGSLYFPLP